MMTEEKFVSMMRIQNNNPPLIMRDNMDDYCHSQTENMKKSKRSQSLNGQ